MPEIQDNTPVEEVAQVEIEEDVIEEIEKPVEITATPEPVEEITIKPEPETPVVEITQEVIIEETTSRDIETTDITNEDIDVDETLSEETAPHVPEGAIPIIVKISHYNPSLGGTNCARFVNGECVSKMSSGERWQDYIDDEKTIACPMEVPFGANIYLDYVEYTCRDRGGAIVITPEGYYWIDILAERVPYYYGELKDAYLYIP